MSDKSTTDLEHELSSSAQLNAFLERNQANMTDIAVHEYLACLIDEKRVSRTTIINKSGLNYIYAYQIFSGKRTPSRNKLLCLCFGLELSAEEVQDFLHCCGYVPLYVRNRRDSIILFALYQKLTLLELNELLFEKGEELVS